MSYPRGSCPTAGEASALVTYRATIAPIPPSIPLSYGSGVMAHAVRFDGTTKGGDTTVRFRRVLSTSVRSGAEHTADAWAAERLSLRMLPRITTPSLSPSTHRTTTLIARLPL